MGRIGAIGGLACLAMAAGASVLTTVPAAAQRVPADVGAQTTPTTSSRTTVTTRPSSTAAYPVLDEDDLPAGYETDVGTPSRRTGFSATYPTIDDCAWNASNRLSGLTPVMYITSFERAAAGDGQENVWEFADTTAAKAFYGYLEDAYRGATKCKVVKQPSTTSPSSLVEIGKFTVLDIGSLGDDSLGITLSPSSGSDDSKYAFILDAKRVGALRVSDDKVTRKQFTALARTADKRLGP